MLNNGFYSAECSDLIVNIIKVQYRDPKRVYVKVKLQLLDKHGNIIERPKNYKLILDNIKHWRRYDYVKWS